MRLRQPITLVALLLAAALSVTAAAAGKKPVRLATLEWEPYIGEKMPDQGYCAALIRAAFATQGMTVDIQFYPWARALHLARTGAVDGLMPEYFNTSRLTEFEFSAPFPGGPLVLYQRSGDRTRFSGDPLVHQDAVLRALKSQRFGVVRGYLNTPVFDAATYLIKDEANDDATNLRKLVYGRIDLAVIDRRVAEHLIRTTYPDYAKKIRPMSPPLADIPLYIAFSLKSSRKTEALTAFNKGLAALQASGQIDALYKRYILNPPPVR